MKLTNANIKNVIILCALLLTLFFCGGYFIYNHMENTNTMRKVNLSEIDIVNQHNNLEKSRQAVQIENGHFSFSQSFKLNPNLERKLQVEQEDFYKYYINQQDKDVLEGDFEVDTLNDGSTIKFIALQGDRVTKVRIKSDEQWYNALQIPFASNATSRLKIEIKWDPKGQGELIIFPIRYDKSDYYSGNNLGLLRTAVLNTNFDINTLKEAQAQTQNEPPSGIPIPALINQKHENVKLVRSDDGTKVSEKYTAIQLKSINYNTSIDAILVDDEGNSEILRSNIAILKNQLTLIELPENLIKKVQSDNKRYFILLLNNRGEKQVGDIVEIINKTKKYPTTFNLVIELFKFNVG